MYLMQASQVKNQMYKQFNKKILTKLLLEQQKTSIKSNRTTKATKNNFYKMNKSFKLKLTT